MAKRSFRLKGKLNVNALAREDFDSFEYYKQWAKPFHRKSDYPIAQKVLEYQKTSNNQLLTEIITYCQPVLFMCANTYAKPGYLMDYISEAQIGLINAIKGYKGNTNFINYALICITRQYQDFINTASLVNYHILLWTVKNLRHKFDNEKQATKEDYKKESENMGLPLSKEQDEYFVFEQSNVENTDIPVELDDNIEFAQTIISLFKKHCQHLKKTKEFEMFMDFIGYNGIIYNYESLASKYNVSNRRAAQIIEQIKQTLVDFYETNKSRI